MKPPPNPRTVEAAAAWREYQAEVRDAHGSACYHHLPAPRFRAMATVERGAWLPCADGLWRWFAQAMTWTWTKGQNDE